MLFWYRLKRGREAIFNHSFLCAFRNVFLAFLRNTLACTFCRSATERLKDTLAEIPVAHGAKPVFAKRDDATLADHRFEFAGPVEPVRNEVRSRGLLAFHGFVLHVALRFSAAPTPKRRAPRRKGILSGPRAKRALRFLFVAGRSPSPARLRCLLRRAGRGSSASRK